MLTMDQNQLGIILAIILALLITITGFLFSLTSITLDFFLTINFLPIANVFLSLYFIGFLVIASLCLATVMTVTDKLEQQKAIIFSLLGYLIGITILLIFFVQIELIFVLLFSGFGIALSIKMHNQDNKTFTKNFKSGASMAGKIVLFFGVGIFVTILLITLPNASEYENSFSSDIIQSFVGGENPSISAPLIASIGQLQKETLSSAQQTPEYKIMQAKNDSDFLKLEMKLEELKLFYTSDEYSKTIAENTSKIIDDSKSKPGFDLELPFVKDIAKYAWLVYALVAFASVVFIGELVIKNLSAFIYAIISKLGNKQNLTK